MASAFSSPIIERADGSAQVLQQVSLSESAGADAYTEDWLQNLLYRHPEALPIRELDESFAGLVPVCREMETPAGPIDVVYVTPSGRPVIVEAKLWRNPEARRKVIGQILDYAKELSRWTYESFDAAVRNARRAEDSGSPKGLADIFGLASQSEESKRLFDSLSQSLRRGDMLLLIVGDGIRENVGAITEFLEGHASLHFTFGLVEMAIFRLPEGGRLVQPRVLAQSTIVRRIVVDMQRGVVLDPTPVDSGADDAEESPEVMENRAKFRRFWEGFHGKLDLDDKSQPVKPPALTQNQYFDMPKGSDAWLAAYLAQSVNRAGVYLTFGKGPIGDRMYEALKADKEAIERAIGEPLDWESDGRKHWIVTPRTYQGDLINVHGEEIQTMMADYINRYVNVFRPRLERLAHAAV
jgi:Domain of unknown function (DUF4268)